MKYIVRNTKQHHPTSTELERFTHWIPNIAPVPTETRLFVCFGCSAVVETSIEQILSVCPTCQVWNGLRIFHDGEQVGSREILTALPY